MSEKKKRSQGQKKEKPERAYLQSADSSNQDSMKTGKKEEKKQEQSSQEPKKEEEIVISKKRQNIQFMIFTGVILIIFLAIVFVPRFIQKATLEKNKYNPSLRLAYDISRVFGMAIEEVFIFDENQSL